MLTDARIDVIHERRNVQIARRELARGAHYRDERPLDVAIVEAHRPQEGAMRRAP